jgi:lipopolysaccharide exporter
MAGVSERIMKGSMLLTVSRAIVNGLGAISMVVLAWFLVPADFGIFAIGTTVLAVVQSFTDLSIGQSLIQRSGLDREDLDTAWTLNGLRGLAVGLGLALGAPLMAVAFVEPRLTAVMIAMGGSIALSGLGSPRLIVMQRELQFWQVSIIDVIQKLSGVTATIVIAALYHSYWALVIGAIVMQVVSTVMSFIIAPYRPRVSFARTKDIFSFSGWVSLGQIVNTLNWRIDYLLLGRFLSTRDVGYYSMGSNLALLPTREAIAPLTKTLFPGLASIADDRERLTRGYQRAQALVTAVSLPVGVGTALIADPLVRLFMGERWIPVIFIIQTLSLIYAIQTIGTQVQPLAMAKGETKLLFVRNVQMLFIRLPILLAGLAFGGMYGMVVARVTAGLVGVFINLGLVRRLIGLPILEQFHANLRALIATVVMAALVAGLDTLMPAGSHHLNLLAKIVVLSFVGAVTYCGVSYLLWRRSGCPTGPESDIARVLQRVGGRLRTSRQN